jgi:hypothetical protein
VRRLKAHGVMLTSGSPPVSDNGIEFGIEHFLGFHAEKGSQSLSERLIDTVAIDYL